MYKLIIILLLPTFCFSQIGNYEITNLFHKEARSFGCAFIQDEISEIKSKTHSELTQELERLANSLDGDNREVQRIKGALLTLNYNPRKKSKIISGLNKICEGALKPISSVIHAISIVNKFALSSAAMPFRKTLNFWKGFSKGGNALEQSGYDAVYKLFGPDKKISSYVLSLFVNEAPNFFLGFNPLYSGINASVALEMIVRYRCESSKLHLHGVKAQRFCNTYEKLGKLFKQAALKSTVKGAELRIKMDKMITRRNYQKDNSVFCSQKAIKQIKQAKRVVKRHYFLNDLEGIQEIGILPKLHKNSCTKITITKKINSDIDLSKLKFIENIEVLIISKGSTHPNLLFSKEERASFSEARNLCIDLQSQYITGKVSNKAEILNDFIKSAVFPETLSKPSFNEVIVQDSLIRKKSEVNQVNVIFSIGPNLESDESIVERMDEYQNAQKRLKKLLKGLEKSADCEIKLESNSGKLEKINEQLKILEGYQSDRNVKSFIEMKAIRKFLEDNKLQLEWKFIATNNVQTVLNAIRDGGFRHIVLVHHSKPSGHLVDSFNNEYPRELFQQIHPGVQSLNLYNCYSSKTKERYQIGKHLGEQESFHKARYFTGVEENTFMNSNSFAPVSGFGTFMKKVDYELFNASRGSDLLQKNFSYRFEQYFPSEKRCEIDLRDVNLSGANYKVLINKELIGIISEVGENSQKIKFSCDLLNLVDNELKLGKVSLGESIAENYKDFHVKINDSMLKWSKEKRYKSYIKLNFNL